MFRREPTCTICGKPIKNNLAITLQNKIISFEDNDEMMEVSTVMCKDCIEDMHKQMNDQVKTIKSEKNSVNYFMTSLDSIYKMYLDVLIKDVSEVNKSFGIKEKEYRINPNDAFTHLDMIMETLSEIVEMKYPSKVQAESFMRTFEFVLRDSIHAVFEEINYSPLVVSDFSEQLTNAFNALKEEFIEDIKGHFDEFLNEEKKDDKADTNFSDMTVYTPSQIKAELDKTVIGQELAKKTVAVGIYNHYKRIQNNKTDIKKSNIMLIGPSGCGKTEIARTVAKILNVPFAIADATSITEAGYVGDDAENMLLKLIEVADGDVKAAERGIIYIDEIDKIARSGEGRSTHRDVSGEGVQQALLKIVEGNEITIPMRSKRNPFGESVTINTENILFICGGAFEDITMTEKTNKLHIGFNSKEVEDELRKDKITSKELIKYGMIPELVGRFPIIAQLDALTIDDLKRILVEPENSIIKQYTNLINIDNVKLDFTESALKWIADKSYSDKTGARGLKTILEQSMLDLMYDLPDEKTITKVQVGVKDGQLDIRKLSKSKKQAKNE